MKKFLMYFISCISCVYLCTAQADLQIVVTQGVSSAIPIAVVPFSHSALPDDVAQLVYQDLARSGEFTVLDPRNINMQRARDFNYWKEQGIDYVILGQIVPLGQQYKVNYELFDVLQASLHTALVAAQTGATTTRPVLLQGGQTVGPTQLRGLAHYISDIVYEKLTGVRGVFSTRIAYITVEHQPGRTPLYKLEVADADGYNPKPLLVSPEPIMSPAWSPNGRQLAYVSFEKQRAEIYISDLLTGQRRLVSKFPGINGAPAFSPDGKKLALVLSKENVAQIYVLDLVSQQFDQITHGASINTEPRWAPDGRSLVFTSSRGGGAQIYRVTLADKKVERLTFYGGYNARGSLTPDGKRLVMIHRSEDAYHIAAQDLTNNQLYILTQTRMDESPSVSPNGRLIIYGTTDGNKRVLAGVSIDGRIKLRLPTSEQGEVQEPAWSPFFG